MSVQQKALLWAAIIIFAAITIAAFDLSQDASFGITAGLAGAAWGALHSNVICGRGCLQ